MSDVTADSYVRTFANGITVRVEPGYSKNRARLTLSGMWREYINVFPAVHGDDHYALGPDCYFREIGKFNREDQTFTCSACKVYLEKTLKYLSELE